MSGRHYDSNRGKDRNLPARDAFEMSKDAIRLLRAVLRKLGNSAGRGAVCSERAEGFDEGMAEARCRVRKMIAALNEGGG